MSFLGVGPTELRIVLAIGNIALIVHPNVGLVRATRSGCSTSAAASRRRAWLGTFVFSCRAQHACALSRRTAAGAAAAMTGWRRWLRFAAVGVLGVASSWACVALAHRRIGRRLPAGRRPPAVLAAVAAQLSLAPALDVGGSTGTEAASAGSSSIFAAGNGAVSLAGNVGSSRCLCRSRPLARGGRQVIAIAPARRKLPDLRRRSDRLAWTQTRSASVPAEHARMMHVGSRRPHDHPPAPPPTTRTPRSACRTSAGTSAATSCFWSACRCRRSPSGGKSTSARDRRCTWATWDSRSSRRNCCSRPFAGHVADAYNRKRVLTDRAAGQRPRRAGPGVERRSIRRRSS